jgi:hypothetical protein
VNRQFLLSVLETFNFASLPMSAVRDFRCADTFYEHRDGTGLYDLLPINSTI